MGFGRTMIGTEGRLLEQLLPTTDQKDNPHINRSPDLSTHAICSHLFVTFDNPATINKMEWLITLPRNRY